MNSVSYFEIQASEPKRAIDFYTAVFGWKFTKDDNIPIDYWRIDNAGPFGGMLERPCPPPPPEQGTNAYTCSVHVENFDKTSEEILKNGGLVAMPKFAVVGKCWQGYFLDTEGNTFGIFEVDSGAK